MKDAVVVLFQLLLLSMSASGQTNRVAALVVDKHGEVMNVCSPRRTIQPMDVLLEGDSVGISRGGMLKILSADGRIEEHTSSWRIAGSPYETRGLGDIITRTHAVLDWVASKKAEKPNNMRGNDPVVFLSSPRNTYVLDSDRLTWSGPSKREYSVHLRCYENGYSLKSTVNDLSCPLEKGALEEGRMYYWHAAYAGQTISEIPAAVWFAKLPSTKRAALQVEQDQLKSIMSPDTTSPAFVLLDTQILIKYELYADAIRRLETIRKDAGKAHFAQALYAFVYDKLDMKQESELALRMTDIQHE